MRSTTLHRGENILLSVLLFGWAATLFDTGFMIVGMGIGAAGLFVFPYLNEERNRAPYAVMGGFLLIAMSLIDGAGILLLMAPVGILEAGILFLWHKSTTVEYQTLGLYGKK